MKTPTFSKPDTNHNAARPPDFEPAVASFDEHTFLLAEDNENDILLLQRAFRESGSINPLHVVSNGEDVINYLRGLNDYANRLEYPQPKVILLDLNLPRKDGFDVLGWIRLQPELKSMVVIILTASNRQSDADRAFAMGADFYLTKPRTFDALVKMMSCLQEWLRANDFTAKDMEPKITAARVAVAAN